MTRVSLDVVNFGKNLNVQHRVEITLGYTIRALRHFFFFGHPHVCALRFLSRRYGHDIADPVGCIALLFCSPSCFRVLSCRFGRCVARLDRLLTC